MLERTLAWGSGDIASRNVLCNMVAINMWSFEFKFIKIKFKGQNLSNASHNSSTQ